MSAAEELEVLESVKLRAREYGKMKQESQGGYRSPAAANEQPRGSEDDDEREVMERVKSMIRGESPSVGYPETSGQPQEDPRNEYQREYDDEAISVPRPVEEEEAERLAATGPQPTTQDQMLLGFINEDPELQAKYLEKEGFKTRISPETGLAEYEQSPGMWVPAREGVMQYWPNILEGIVAAGATGTKALGLIGAPATGGASIAASAGLGAIAGAGVESAKQQAARGLGLRDDINQERIGEKALETGALTGAADVAGKAIGAGMSGLGKMIVGRKRPPKDLASKEEVKKAADFLDVVPTPGMLTKDPTFRKVEAALDSLEFTPGGAITRARSKNIRAAINEVADELVSSKTLRTPNEVGDKFKETITKAVEKKLEPAEEIYNRIEKDLGGVKVNYENVKAYFQELVETSRWDPTGAEMSFIKKVYDKLNSANSVADLKILRNKTAKAINRDASPGLREVHDGLYEILSKVRQDSFELAVQRAPKDSGKAELFNQLKEADKIWRDVSRQVDAVFVPRGQRMRFGPKAETANRLRNQNSSSVLNDFFPRQDVERAMALKELSPEAFSDLAAARVAEIAEKSISTGEGNQGKRLFGALAREIDKLAPEIAEAIFGKDAMLKKKAAQTLFRNVPFNINPSGTAKTQNILQTTATFLNGIRLSTLGTALRANNFMETTVGKKYLQNLSKAGLITGNSATGLLKTVRESQKDVDQKDSEK